jgi:nucleoside-diphosphate-sugar epimerase
MNKQVLLIGGTGYVGGWIIRALRDATCDIHVLTRANNSFLSERFGVFPICESDLKHLRSLDAVVNLAYPTETDLHNNLGKTRSLFKTIQLVASRSPLLIHFSTQAVFGYDLSPPFLRAKVKMRLDHAYIESKILMENLILDSDLSCTKRIIRLGNVWGPASAAWTAKIAKKLLFMEPVGILGKDGFSNATDVRNIASYIAFIIGLKSLPPSGIDHLAELGPSKWSELIKPMARELKRPVVLAEFAPPPEESGWIAPLANLFSGLSPKSLGLTILKGRKAGALFKRTLEWLPDAALQKARKIYRKKFVPGSSIGLDDPIFLRIMSEEKCFHNNTIPGWTPAITLAESNHYISEWLHSSGFVNAAIKIGDCPHDSSVLPLGP